MSELFKSTLLITWRRNGAYALRLVGDLSEDQMIAQPVAGHVMNHPAWLMAHLNCYNEVIARMLRRQLKDDPVDHPFGMKSTPSAAASDYPQRAMAIEAYRRSHDDAEQALQEADEGVFSEPAPLPRWRTAHPKIADMALMLMSKHESLHLGQLSAWRRAMGLPRVEM